MARARSGGGMAVALVLFTIAFVFALIAAIVFASQKSAAMTQRDEAEAQLRKVALSGEIAAVQLPPGTSGTLVGYLSSENQLLKRMISSQPEVPAASLDERRKAMHVESALLDEIQQLNNNLAAEKARADQAEAARDAAVAQAQAAAQSAAALNDEYNAKYQELSGQIEQAKQGAETFRDSIKGSDTALADQMAQTRKEKDQRISELEQTLRQRDIDVMRLQQQLDDRGGTDVAGGENIIAADGQITGLADDGQIVYMNLGSREHLLLGTTFEVFGENELVKTDESSQVRGKATLEVVNVEENGSQARIVRRGHRATLRPGDKLVNLVFDPNKTYRFHIYGDFDVNQDGDATEAERLLVESMVRSWGGIVTDEMGYDVDYLVLGSEPPLPEQLGDVIDPVAIQRNVEQRAVYERYQTLKADAMRLRIPILNQNRFLALIGYYER